MTIEIRIVIPGVESECLCTCICLLLAVNLNAVPCIGKISVDSSHG